MTHLNRFIYLACFLVAAATYSSPLLGQQVIVTYTGSVTDSSIGSIFVGETYEANVLVEIFDLRRGHRFWRKRSQSIRLRFLWWLLDADR